jgi:DNA-binding response OmpR family regulator
MRWVGSPRTLPEPLVDDPGTRLVSTYRMIVDLALGLPLDLSGGRIALIVEDDPRLQRAMREELERMHFCVLSASHCAAALVHLLKRTANIVCIDIGLPNESGYELCEYIRGPLGLTRVPIIVTSELGTSHDMAHAEAARANAFLRKPFSMRELAQCVRSMLDHTPGRALPVHDLALRYGDPGSRSMLATPLATSVW